MVVTVPLKRRDVPPGTLRDIVKDAGLTVEEFVALL
jgi:predicted RNA binding protein YcfA (HicA-like mRNA interferase family)